MQQPILKLSHTDYFALECETDQRHEYLAGEVFAMAGGSESHALISSNAIAALSLSLRDRPCRVYGSDMRLYIHSIDKFCYPDVTVLCEEGKRSMHYIESPVLLIETLSPNTESYDRGLKFEHYRQIDSLRYYLLLTQDRPHAELFTRASETAWILSECSGMGGELLLSQWNIRLPLQEIYRLVDFSQSEGAIQPA